MKILTIPNWSNYGMDEDGQFYSKRKGEWCALKMSDRLSLHRGGEVMSITRWKYRYCVQHQIAPEKIDGRNYLVGRDGKAYTPSVRSIRANKKRDEKDSHDAVEKLKRTRDFAQLCIDYIEGRKEGVFTLVQEMRDSLDAYLKQYSRIKELRYDSIMEAEEQFYPALEKARVSNPMNWMKGRSRGILMYKQKTFKRIQDYDNFRSI